MQNSINIIAFKYTNNFSIFNSYKNINQNYSSFNFESHERLQTYDPDVHDRAIYYASLERTETVHQALAKANYIHGTGNSIRQGKYESYGSAKLRSQ